MNAIIKPALRGATAGRRAQETKFLAEPPAEVAADGTFEGYASLFGVPDLGKDVVVPGAFAASLARRGASGVRMLWQHDPAEPIGRWLTLAEDSRGLRVRGKLNLAVARAREIHALMGEGAIDGLSIGFRVEQARPDRARGLRRLEKLDLWEISIVTFPMLPGARVSAVKRSLSSPPCGEGSGVGVETRSQDGAARSRAFFCTRSPGGTTPIPAPPRKGEGSAAPFAHQLRRAARRLFTVSPTRIP